MKDHEYLKKYRLFRAIDIDYKYKCDSFEQIFFMHMFLGNP